MFFQKGSVVERVLTTATSGGTLTLLNDSETYQIFTGSSDHTLKLPAANTMPVGRRFEVINESTGIITVQDNDENELATLAEGESRIFRLVDNSTAAGEFDVTQASSGADGGGLSEIEQAQIAAASTGSYSETSRKVEFNPEQVGANYWKVRSALPIANGYGAGAAIDGYHFGVAGINTGGSISSTVNRFDKDNNYWLARQSVNAQRYDFGLSSKDNAMYAISGIDVSILTSVEKYDYETNIWASIASVGTGRQENRSIALDQIYNIGGSNTANGGASNSHEAYNEASNTWIARTNALTSSAAFGIFTLNKFGYKLGGNTSGNQAGSSLTNAERYDEMTNSWRSIASLPTATVYPCVGDGNALGFGYFIAGRIPSATTNVYKYNDTTNSYSAVASVSVAKDTPAVSTISGSVISAGGGAYTDTVDEYISASYLSVNISKKSKAVPTSIFVSAKIAGLTPTVPVQLRTDGNTWKTFEANKDGVLKLGETFKSKFKEFGLNYAAAGDNNVSSPMNNNSEYDVSKNAWTSRTALNTAVIGAGGFSLGGSGFVVGGWASSSITATQQYDDILNAVTVKSPMATARSHMAAFTIDDLGYVSSGIDGFGVSTEAYSKDTNSWTSKASMPTPGRTSFGASWNLLGRGFVCGGSVSPGSDINAVTTVNEYNPITNSWSTKASMSTARAQGSGFAVSGHGYVPAGSNGSFQSSVEKYNPETNSWAAAASLSSVRFRHASSTVEDFGYIRQGYTGSGTTQDHFQYNPAANSWATKTNVNFQASFGTSGFTPGTYRNYELRVGIPRFVAGLGAKVSINRANLNSAKSGHANVSFNGSHYAIGHQAPLVERYNFESNTWMIETPTTATFDEFGAFALLGQLYCAGYPTTAAERYNPETRSWSSVGSTSASEVGAAGASLNGYGYKVGGSAAAEGRNEQYNPSTNSWSTKTSANTVSVGGYTSCVTLSGSIYSVAGFNVNATGNASTYCEKYNDAANTWTATTLSSNISGGTFGGMLNSEVAVFAGGTSGSISSRTARSNIDEYNSVLDVWNSKGSLNTARDILGHGNSGYAGGAMFAGGYNGSILTSTEQYLTNLDKLILSVGLNVKE